MTKTIAKVTPLIRLPSQVDVFDYFVPPDLEDKIKVGQMLSIPWRNRYVNGVVLSLGEPPPIPPLVRGGLRGSGGFRTRPVKKIIEPQPVLTSAQLALIKKFSDYYFVAPGSVARLITPARPTRIGKTAATFPKDNQPISFKIEKPQLAQLASAAEKIKKPANHIETGDISSFVWLIFYLLTKQSCPVLLLLPTLNLINIFSSALKKYQEQTAVIHSGLALGAYWQTYQKILNHQTRIIISTRQGVFLPIPTNSTIIMFDSGSPDFKQYDQHPRYDARLAATWLAELTKSQLILINPSPLPSGEGGPPASQGEASRAGVSGALPTAIRQKSIIQLIDMKQKLLSPEFSILPDEVIDEITQAKTARKKAVIIALREEADKGVSVNKIKDALTKLVKDDKNDIIVGTSDVLDSGQLLPYRGQIACLILASIEPLLAIPDYRAAERAFYRLKHWQMWAQELAIPKIILQSYSPDNLAVRAFAYGETEHFISAELETRKRFDYPPFTQLIKLTYQGKDEGEIARVAALLKARASDKLIVRGPYQARKSERKSILLKTKNGADLSVLRTLSSAWAIDKDPENVL